MVQPDDYTAMRDVWTDFDARQVFEHGLINTKTTWMLTTQALLFAAYGVTFDTAGTDAEIAVFRYVVALSGLALGAVTLIGVLALIYSKFRSWRTYRAYYIRPKTLKPPEPLRDTRLEWGVYTPNTLVTLVPDVLIPVVFILAWSGLMR